MRFGSKIIPGQLFALARDRMLAVSTFTPEGIRQHLLNEAPDLFAEITPIDTNKWIVANRVMRSALKELVDSGEVAQVKRGVWALVSEQACSN